VALANPQPARRWELPIFSRKTHGKTHGNPWKNPWKPMEKTMEKWTNKWKNPMECVSMFPQMLSYTLTKVYNSMAETLMETCSFLGEQIWNLWPKLDETWQWVPSPNSSFLETC